MLDIRNKIGPGWDDNIDIFILLGLSTNFKKNLKKLSYENILSMNRA